MDDSKLIELVREHQSIYNPKHHQYKDSNVRDNVWDEIATVMKISVEECKYRWKNIRDTYMRRKRNKKLPTGSSRPKTLRKWHLEEHLVFLNLVECERQTLTNTVESEKQETQRDDDIQYETQEMEEDPDVSENLFIETLDVSNTDISSIAEQQSEDGAFSKSSSKRKSYGKISLDNVVKLFLKNSDDRAKLLSTILAKPTIQEHPIDAFFHSMAISVKKMTLESQIRAKMEICQIVGQLELEEIRKTTSSSSSVLSSNPTSHGSTSDQSPPSLVKIFGLNFHEVVPQNNIPF